MLDWIRRAVVTYVYPGNRQKLQAQVLDDEVPDLVPHAQPYGLCASPPIGAELVIAYIDGDRSHPIAIVVSDHRHTIIQEPGETCLHNDVGMRIHLTKDGIVIHGGGKPVIVDAPELRCTGNVSDLIGTMQEIRAT